MANAEIGRYRWPWAGCQAGYGDVLYTTSPYYAIRCVGLLAIKRDVIQVLINGIGGLCWINVSFYQESGYESYRDYSVV